MSATPTDGRKRAWTILDDRQLIQADIPVKGLETESKIPLHMPLEVLGERILIPREAEPGKLELPAPGDRPLPTDADERMAVPVDAHPKELVAETFLPIEVLEQEDLVTADVFTTGQVKLMPKQVSELPGDRNWMVPAGSLVFHLVLALTIFGLIVLFPHHEPTQAELEAASRELGIVYLPNSMFNQPKSAPRSAPPGEKLHVDPGLIKKLMPDVLPTPTPEVPAPQPVAPRPTRELPSAPVPQAVTPAPPIDRPAPPPHFDAVKPVPDAPNAQIKLPTLSARQSIDQGMNSGIGRGQTPPVGFAGSLGRGGGGMGGGGGGGGGGFGGAGLQMLTPDQGIDFSGYLNRVLAKVRQEWYTTMPESARMGDRGRVVIDFKIMRDGSVPVPEPILRQGSGKDPLDRGALSAISASNPFEPLPSAFSGPFIELRFIFFYNYRPEEIQ